MERTLKVTGQGRTAVKPDRVRLVIHLEGTRENYDETLQLSAEKTEQLRDCFGKLGFDRAELKTTAFHVNTKYERCQEKDKSWKQRFAGYEFRHSLKLEFDADSGLTGRVLYAAAHSQAAPRFHIQYTVKDVEAVKNSLIGQAVKDSKVKAEILAQAAGVRLGDILSVDYSWGEVEIVSGPVNQMDEACRGIALTAASEGTYDMGMEPEEIEVSDHVTVIWAIG